MRQVVLDTETTGLDPHQGHRVIEIGGVEIVNRRLTGRHLHFYMNPDRDIDEGALRVHGIERSFLDDKPRFEDVAHEILEFLNGAELIIHNAPFDLGFLDSELRRLPEPGTAIAARCKILDTLAMAKERHPGQRNNLDALCKRYFVDNSTRDLHGALLDAEILADVYLAMTGGQAALDLSAPPTPDAQVARSRARKAGTSSVKIPVVRASEEERAKHEQLVGVIDAASKNGSVWRRYSS